MFWFFLFVCNFGFVICVFSEDSVMRFILKIKLPSWFLRPFVSASLFFHRLRFGRSACFIYIARLRFAVIDHADYDILKWFKWRLCRSGRILYAFCTIPQGPLLPPKVIWMHHLVLPPPPGHCIDHKNHIGLDNRLQNLRVATPSENNHNARKTKSKTSSKYKGVDFVKPTKKWRARIAVNNKRLFLGSFDSELDAAITYDVAAKQYFGEFACLNFP
jgi:hypothetical protein